MANDPTEQALRLNALRSYDILDTPPEPEFDDVVALASKLCDTPIAAVAFADAHRFWSKAMFGFSEPNCDWDHGLCSIAFDQRVDPLIVEDLAVDPRFQSKVFVHGAPYLRFYASVQLRAPSGQSIGTLCVLDLKPRPGGLTPSQLDGLKALGRHTMALLWLRVTLAGVAGAKTR